jgi:hypothetical protein
MVQGDAAMTDQVLVPGHAPLMVVWGDLVQRVLILALE